MPAYPRCCKGRLGAQTAPSDAAVPGTDLIELLPDGAIAVWYAGHDGAGSYVTTEGNGYPVDAWTDVVGGITPVEEGADRPNYYKSLAVFNGHSGLSFSGAQHLSIDLVENWIGNRETYSIYVVFATTDEEATNAGGLHVADDDEQASINVEATYNDGLPHLLNLRRLASASFELFLDGVSIGTSTASPGTTGIDLLEIGRMGADYFAGQVACILIYPDTTTRYAVEYVIREYYGVDIPSSDEMSLYTATALEFLPTLMENQEITGPVSIIRVSNSDGSWPGDILVYTAETQGLRHCFIHDVHDVQQDAYASDVAAEDKIGHEWYDVCSLNNGWYSPDDEIRPGGLHGHPAYIQNEELDPLRTYRKCVFSGIATAGKWYSQSNSTIEGLPRSKTANFLIEDCIFIGPPYALWGNFVGSNRDAVNVTVKNCIFINCNVTFGYNGITENNLFEGNVVFGTLTVKAGTDISLINNTVITTGPYRPNGTLYDNGTGNISVNWGAAANYLGDSVFSGNVLYTDGPESAFNGRNLAQATAEGYMVGDTIIGGGVADFDAYTRRIAIPEKNAEWYFIYNPEELGTHLLDKYYRVRDPRRWHTSEQVTNVLTMAGTPDAPLNWDWSYGAPPIAPSIFPRFGVFRLES